MKATVRTTALGLMVQNGTTSTKEVKDAIHAQRNDPNFVLRQAEVSSLMKELAREEGWNGRFNGTFIEYSNPNAQVVSTFAPTPAPPATSTNDPLTAQYSSYNPSHGMIGYISGNPGFYASGVDKNDVRRKIFMIATSGFNLNITYDDINYCTADHFLNKYGK